MAYAAELREPTTEECLLDLNIVKYLMIFPGIRHSGGRAEKLMVGWKVKEHQQVVPEEC